MVKAIWFMIITILVSIVALTGLVIAVVKLIRKREE